MNCLANYEVNKDIKNIIKLKTNILKNYWEESGNIDFIKNVFKLPEIKSYIKMLINEEPI